METQGPGVTSEGQPGPELIAALCDAQESFPEEFKRDKKGHYGTYLTLAGILDGTRKALATNGLVIVQMLRLDGVLETSLLHTSGQRMTSLCFVGDPVRKRLDGVG